MKTTTYTIRIRNFIFFILLSLISFNCKKDNTASNAVNPTPAVTATLPAVTTTPATSIVSTAAISGGDITSDGGASITARGVCWSTITNPVNTGNHTDDNSGTGTYTSNITGLIANQTYYVRAYATNSVGTAYGNELTFITANPSVFVAGYEFVNGQNVAKLWQDGVATSLPGGTYGADASSVFVVGNDVYVGGKKNVSTGPDWVAEIWKKWRCVRLIQRF